MKTLLSYLGLFLEIFAVFSFFPLIVAFIYGESTTPFFIMFVVSVSLGIILEKSFRRKQLDLLNAIALTTASFLFFSTIGSIPYLFYIEGSSVLIVVNSFFESMSGFTTTGLTIFSSVENLPRSLLFWRALTQWIGGMGIIIIFLSVLRSIKTSSLNLYQTQGMSDKIETSIIYTARFMLKIYLVYTTFGVIALFATGLPLFDSVATAMTAISTGGFCVVDDFYTNPWTLLVVSVLMIAGSINFMIHSKIFRKNFSDFFANSEIKSIGVMLVFLVSVGYIISHSATISLFQMISALTATGYSIVEISVLPAGFIFFVIVAMVVGSSSGSTAGGIKQMRFIIIMKSILWTIKKTGAPPKAIIPFKIAGKSVDSEVIKTTGVFIFTYLLFLIVGSVVLMSSGYSPHESVFQTASAQGTVGFSIIELSTAPILVKITLCVSMLLGRLEIFPVLVLIQYIVSR